MGLSVVQLTMVAVVGVLATMSILKARQYHAQVNEQMELAERAIVEKDTVLSKCDNDRTELKNSAQKVGDKMKQLNDEKNEKNSKVKELEGIMVSLRDAQNTCSIQLGEYDDKLRVMELQVAQSQNASATQAVQLQEELKKTQDDLSSAQGKLVEGKNATDAQVLQLTDDLKKTQDDLSSTQDQLKQAQDQLAAAAAAGAAAAKAATVVEATEPAKDAKKKA